MTSTPDRKEVCFGFLVPGVLVRPPKREVAHLGPLKPVAQEGKIIWIWRFKSRYRYKLGKAAIYFKDDILGYLS
jgi:hypothetical protein